MRGLIPQCTLWYTIPNIVINYQSKSKLSNQLLQRNAFFMLFENLKNQTFLSFSTMVPNYATISLWTMSLQLCQTKNYDNFNQNLDQRTLVSIRYTNERFEYLWWGFKYILVSPVLISRRGKKLWDQTVCILQYAISTKCMWKSFLFYCCCCIKKLWLLDLPALLCFTHGTLSMLGL